jgi:hypothetical protein
MLKASYSVAESKGDGKDFSLFAINFFWQLSAMKVADN